MFYIMTYFTIFQILLYLLNNHTIYISVIFGVRLEILILLIVFFFIIILVIHLTSLFYNL